jgi:hypothetical protein
MRFSNYVIQLDNIIILSKIPTLIIYNRFSRMDLNIISFSYLFLRLAPFILVCFFTLTSIFNQDFKGLVYLAGLLFSCFITILIGTGLSDLIPMIDATTRPEICNMVTIGQGGDISKLPLGQSSIGFTFGYLLYTIVKENFVKQNIATIVFFPILLLFDLIWNATNSCYSVMQLIISLVVGGLSGVLWSYIISLSGNPQLQYFVGVNNGEVCSAPTKSTFKCRVYQNGKLLAGNVGATPIG